MLPRAIASAQLREILEFLAQFGDASLRSADRCRQRAGVLQCGDRDRALDAQWSRRVADLRPVMPPFASTGVVAEMQHVAAQVRARGHLRSAQTGDFDIPRGRQNLRA
jgi:hypothetical protein